VVIVYSLDYAAAVNRSQNVTWC